MPGKWIHPFRVSVRPHLGTGPAASTCPSAHRAPWALALPPPLVPLYTRHPCTWQVCVGCKGCQPWSVRHAPAKARPCVYSVHWAAHLSGPPHGVQKESSGPVGRQDGSLWLDNSSSAWGGSAPRGALRPGGDTGTLVLRKERRAHARKGGCVVKGGGPGGRAKVHGGRVSQAECGV